MRKIDQLLLEFAVASGDSELLAELNAEAAARSKASLQENAPPDLNRFKDGRRTYHHQRTYH